jgi:hypothetical protein
VLVVLLSIVLSSIGMEFTQSKDSDTADLNVVIYRYCAIANICFALIVMSWIFNRLR